MNPVNIKLSIVIIGRNEETRIGKCFEAAIVAAGEIGDTEIIYVDSDSTDNTIAIAQSYGVRVIPLDRSLRRTPSAGRFYGSQHSQGDFILFLDADTLIYQDFLPTALKYFEYDSKLCGVNGQIDDLNETGKQLFDIEERSENVIEVEWLRGPSCLYKRKDLIDAGSFDPDLAVEEEAELGLRLIRNGWRLAVIPHPMSCHTRCYHGQSIESIISTFRRDIRSKRLGEITKTISHAFRAGNGFAFCWLRLKTTILFAAWILVMAMCLLLPNQLQPKTLLILTAIAGSLCILIKKRNVVETVLFVPSKIINLVDVFAGIHKIAIGTPHVKSKRM